MAITLEPFPVMAFIVVLSADRGVRKGLAFILARLACLVVVIACVLLFTGGSPPRAHSTPSTAVLGAKLAIGVGLIAYGVHKHRGTGRPRRDRTSPAKREVSVWTAAGLAVLLQPWGSASGWSAEASPNWSDGRLRVAARVCAAGPRPCGRPALPGRDAARPEPRFAGHEHLRASEPTMHPLRRVGK